MESVGYLCVYFAKGYLPWEKKYPNAQKPERRRLYGMCKTNTSIKELCSNLPSNKYFFSLTKQKRSRDISLQSRNFILRINLTTISFVIYFWILWKKMVMKMMEFSTGHWQVMTTVNLNDWNNKRISSWTFYGIENIKWDWLVSWPFLISFFFWEKSVSFFSLVRNFIFFTFVHSSLLEIMILFIFRTFFS